MVGVNLTSLYKHLYQITSCSVIFLWLCRRLSDVLKRKKPPKRPARKGNKNDDSPEVDKKTLGVGRSSRSKGSSKEKSSSSSSSKMSFLPSLNPRSWGKLGSSSSSSSSSSDRPLLSKVCVGPLLSKVCVGPCFAHVLTLANVGTDPSWAVPSWGWLIAYILQMSPFTVPLKTEPCNYKVYFHV